MVAKYHVVTTCSLAGWEQTGRRMVKSFTERWPEEARPLTVYAEGFDPEPSSGIIVKRLPSWLDEFKSKHKDRPAHNGLTRNGYDFRFDAVKFAHKVAALTDFGLGLNDGMMIWLDADTFTHADVTVEWLEGLFPGSGYLAWLDRTNCYPECGVVMYRASHPYHLTFMDRFRDFYTSGRIFKLSETHDSFVLQHLVKMKTLAGKIKQPVSLSGSARTSSHPAANGPISTCLDHMKGGRKVAGRTPKTERRLIHDGNPYWAA